MTGATPHTLAAVIAPPALVLPLAAATMLLIAGHMTAMWRTRDRIPYSRLRIRMANGAVMLLACPLIAAGFSLIDPAARREPFVLVWLGVVGLLLNVLLLALIDLGNTYRITASARQELRLELARTRRLLAEELAARRRGGPGEGGGDG